VYHEGELMLMLMRSDHIERAFIHMQANGEWSRIDMPEGFDKGGRRPFNRLTQDEDYLYFAPKDASEEMGYFIRTPLDNPGVFERYGVPIGDGQMDSVGNFAMTYVPDWGRFYAYTPGGKVWSWTHGEPSWNFHGRTPLDQDGLRASGYAGVLLWNSVRQELIIAGGQPFGSPPGVGYKAARLTEPLGDIEGLPDMLLPNGDPLIYTSAQNKLIVDPRNGSYVQIHKDKVIYQNDTIEGTWSFYDTVGEEADWPFGSYELYAPYAFVPGTDVIVFVSHLRGVVLHRLKSESRP